MRTDQSKLRTTDRKSQVPNPNPKQNQEGKHRFEFGGRIRLETRAQKNVFLIMMR
jgi:hypothetical protein